MPGAEIVNDFNIGHDLPESLTFILYPLSFFLYLSTIPILVADPDDN